MTQTTTQTITLPLVTTDAAGNVYTLTITPFVPTPPPRTLPSVVRTPFAAATGAVWPAWSAANPDCAWNTASIVQVPDTLTKIQRAPSLAPAESDYGGIILSNTEEIYGPGTYSVTTPIVMSGTNSAITGVAGQTVFNWTGPAGGTMIQLTGSGLTVQGVTFTGPCGQVFANEGQGSDILIYNCACPAGNAGTFANFADTGAPGVGGPTRWAIINCTVGILSQYAVFAGGVNGVIQGNTIAGSLNQDVVRGTGINLVIANNIITNATGLAAIAYQGGDHCSIVGNTVSGGPIEVGPILTTQAVNPPTCAQVQVAENTISHTCINVDPGCFQVSLFSNAMAATPTCINVNGPSAAHPTLDVKQIWIYGNDLYNNGANGSPIKFFSNWTSGAGIQAWIDDTVTTQIGVTIGPSNYYSASFTALCPDLSPIKFGGSSPNTWGKPAGYVGVPVGDSFLIGGQTAASQYQAAPKGDKQL